VVIPISLERLCFTEHYASDTQFLLPPIASVPAGPVLLGSDPQRDPHAATNYELPQHVVELASFLIGIFPVTVAEYACAVRSGAVREPPPAMHVIFNWELQLNHPIHPVTCVIW
jgi:formylglycine-generating enzyme required for sulfatase activity